MPKLDAWIDDSESHLKISCDKEYGIIINLDGFEFGCGAADAREIGQTLIEMAEQFDE